MPNPAVRLTCPLTGLILLVACEAPEASGPAPAIEQESALGIELPYRVEPACPGEGCTYGVWLACDSIPLYRAPGETSPTDQYLSRAQAFEVTSGVVLVDAPTVVVVTRPTRQLPASIEAVTFEPGDTVYVLDYLGEGFFNAFYADSILEVEAFWPWGDFHPGQGFEYGGEVVRQGASSFWIQTADDEGSEAWVWADSAAVAAPNALDPDPPVCR